MENVATNAVTSKYFRGMMKSWDPHGEAPSKEKVKDHFQNLETNIRQAQLKTTTVAG
jgi:hypothetical protein